MSSFAGRPLSGFLDDLAAKTPTPGGGAVASVVGALAGALAGMVVAYSVGKKSLAEHEPSLRDAAQRLGNARALLLALADEDAAAYAALNELMRLPETDPRRIAGEPDAVRAGVEAPMNTLAACVDLLRLFDRLPGITNRHLRSDLAIAAILADAGARAARWNVHINLASVKDEAQRERWRAQGESLCRAGAGLLASVEARCV